MSRRSSGIAALLLAISALVLAHYVQVWAAIPKSQSTTSDFAGTYAAASLWRSGHSADLYNVPVEERLMASEGVPANHLYIPFENPPAAAVLVAPLTALDAAGAYRVWSILQLLMLAAALWIAARTALWGNGVSNLAKLATGGLALAGFGTGLLFVEGQWDGLSALGLALAYAGWRRGRPGWAGFALAVTAAIAKPHLAVGIAAFMLGRRDWRALAGATAGVLAVVGGSLLVVGPGGISAFVAAVLTPSNSPLAQMQGATGLFSSLLGVTIGAYALALVASLFAVAAAGLLGAISRRRGDLLEPALAGAVALSLFASLHLLGHDLTLLAPMFVVFVAWQSRIDAAERRPWPGRSTLVAILAWVALSLATMADLGNRSIGFPPYHLGFPGRITPWALLLLAGLFIRPVVVAAIPSSSLPVLVRRRPADSAGA
jgi:hypothetical protein